MLLVVGDKYAADNTYLIWNRMNPGFCRACANLVVKMFVCIISIMRRGLVTEKRIHFTVLMDW